MPEVTNPAACSLVIVWASAPAGLIAMWPPPPEDCLANRQDRGPGARLSERESYAHSGQSDNVEDVRRGCQHPTHEHVARIVNSQVATREPHNCGQRQHDRAQSAG